MHDRELELLQQELGTDDDQTKGRRVRRRGPRGRLRTDERTDTSWASRRLDPPPGVPKLPM